MLTRLTGFGKKQWYRPADRYSYPCDDMEKKIQKWSLPLGMASLGSYGLIIATTSSNKDEAATLFLLFAFAAGLFWVNASRFFSGLALAIFCMCAYMAIGLTERERSYGGIIIELMFAVILSSAAIAFFAGYLLRRIAKAFSARKIIE